MNKIVKGCIIGTIFIGTAEFAFALGKASILGTLLKYNASAEEAISILDNDKRIKLRCISLLAKIFKEES